MPLVAVALLAGCAIAKPRTDDPLEKYNRKVYAFNDALDRAVIRPVAVGYRKVTNPPVRRSISDFFTNLRMPVTIANDLLQARPKQALKSSGRFLVNLTLGIGGFFDPASQLGLPLEDNDFGVTLARWGVPEGDFLMLPFVGPTTARDVWRLPVDSYFFDPLSRYARHHDFKAGQYYLPEVLYLVTLRARAIDAEGFLKSAYDPYVFLRDAYRQQRIYEIYDGNPPAEIIEQMQGLKDDDFDPEQLLDEQHQWENQHPGQANQPPEGQPPPQKQ
ncbi:phospholipid-binding lipoprotein MlaA [Fulvimonas soli]|jgi:phospholipid-binding lipoprotein MlaA|uniref:Phospholipid-binding lipoprotein MlaA n=2 Tax=Fulvimonas soli TaxID=155197 RepID=A0A316HU19_9GAMM|nr:phospholipid-binding lipoprotein MlaA [Fulvimonas soli]